MNSGRDGGKQSRMGEGRKKGEVKQVCTLNELKILEDL